MSTQMADPYQGMVSFQKGLRAGILEVGLVPKHQDLYSHFDLPAPGVNRLTYVWLTEDRRTVKAFLSCMHIATPRISIRLPGVSCKRECLRLCRSRRDVRTHSTLRRRVSLLGPGRMAGQAVALLGDENHCCAIEKCALANA